MFGFELPVPRESLGTTKLQLAVSERKQQFAISGNNFPCPKIFCHFDIPNCSVGCPCKATKINVILSRTHLNAPTLENSKRSSIQLFIVSVNCCCCCFPYREVDRSPRDTSVYTASFPGPYVYPPYSPLWSCHVTQRERR